MNILQSNMLSGPKPRRVQYSTLKPLLTYKPTDFRRYIIEKRLRTLREYSLYTKRSIRVQHRESVQRCALSVGTHFAGSNIDALRLAIQDLGFNEVSKCKIRLAKLIFFIEFSLCINSKCRYQWLSPV